MQNREIQKCSVNEKNPLWLGVDMLNLLPNFTSQKLIDNCQTFGQPCGCIYQWRYKTAPISGCPPPTGPRWLHRDNCIQKSYPHRPLPRLYVPPPTEPLTCGGQDTAWQGRGNLLRRDRKGPGNQAHQAGPYQQWVSQRDTAASRYTSPHKACR